MAVKAGWKLAVACFLLRSYYALLRLTVRIDLVGREPLLAELSAGLCPVFAVPHYSLLVGLLTWEGRKATVLVSQSSDGELAASLLTSRGFRVVRGSSSRGGREALIELIKSQGRGESVAIAFDGPRGPALKPKPGIALCASYASGSLYLAYAEPCHELRLRGRLGVRLKSWDRFLLPLPFARLRLFHQKIEVNSPKIPGDQAWVTEALQELESRARAACEPVRV